ncbi:MAG TPA: ATP-binding protein [Candidatus Eisenbacteria bacterium]
MPVRAWVRRFPRDIAALPEIFDFAHEFAAESGVAAEPGHALDLVLEELFTNLVRHNRDGRHDIEVGLERRDGAIQLTLRDFDVTPFDPTTVPSPDLTLPLEEQTRGGRGIHLVRQLAREFRYGHRDGVSAITVSLSLSPRQER